MNTASILLAQAASNSNPIIKGSVLDNKTFNPDYLFGKEVSFFQTLFSPPISSGVAAIYHGILIFLAIFFLAIIFYCAVRMFEIRKKEHHHLEKEIEEYAHHQREREKQAQHGEQISKNPRWIKTIDYLFSQHENDWKLAIIEADSMLESLMKDLGFQGSTLGEKLKSAAGQGNFRNLDAAWEVHTIRNRIAHEGATFELSNHEAKRAIALYEQIFRDYGYI